MRKVRTIRARGRERGIALLISIFILLLISIVAIALIVASGTESALAGNYRSSTGVYYAALAGLEEGRGRLSAKDPNTFNNTLPGYFPAPGGTLPIGTVLYVLNPGPTDNLGTMLTTYPDTEYDTEFGAGKLAAATVTTTTSIWNMAPLNGLGIPGPLYKWVRINAVSEQSINLDVNPLDGVKDASPPVFYDPVQLLNTSNNGAQVLEITSFAQLPNGSQKIAQYLVGPMTLNMPTFPAALTLAGGTGNTVTFSAPTSNASYRVSGNDMFVPELPSCTPGAPVDAIAVYHTLAIGDVVNGGNGGTGIPTGYQHSYTGAHAAPDVQRDPIANFQMPSQLNALAQSIIQNADAFVPAGNWSTQTAYMNSLGMSSSNVMTVVSNGDLDLTHWDNVGYGLLLVTGTYTMDPDNGWRGIVLVIGNGVINNSDNNGSQEFDGAVLVANTNNPDPNLGALSVTFQPPMEGNGIRYSSCWIQKALPVLGYKILSFHEISQ